MVGLVDGRRINLEYQPLTLEREAYYELRERPLPIRLSLPADITLPAGTHVEVRIYYYNVHDVLRVPTTTLHGSGIHRHVYRLYQGVVQMAEVEIGAIMESYAEVVYGLSEGDVLIVDQIVG